MLESGNGTGIFGGKWYHIGKKEWFSEDLSAIFRRFFGNLTAEKSSNRLKNLPKINEFTTLNVFSSVNF